jgi:hypothetical protein
MTKKTIQILIFCLITSVAFSQKHITINHIESRLITNEGVEFIGELIDVNDDLYAFESWDNEIVIFNGEQQYIIENLNFNVTTNTFNSRVKRDQLFSYKSDQLENVTINNHLFKKVGETFYEVLYEENEQMLLKKYEVKYKAGSVSRLNGSVGKSTVSLEFKYLIKSKAEIKMIELNKKSITNLVTNEQILNIFESFVEEENLSYRNEDDTVKMVAFILKNT